SSGDRTTAPSGQPTLWAEVPVQVASESIAGLQVLLRHGWRVRGHIQFDGTSPPPPAARLAGLPVQLLRSDGRTAPFLPAVPEGSGVFVTPELPPGQYLLAYTPPAPWTVRSATVDGHDVSDTPLEIGTGEVSEISIVLTDRA